MLDSYARDMLRRRRALATGRWHSFSFRHRLVVWCGILVLLILGLRLMRGGFRSRKNFVDANPSVHPIMRQLGSMLLSVREGSGFGTFPTSRRALVIVSHEQGPDANLFGLLLRIRTIGGWSDDIVVVFVKPNPARSSNLEALGCLRVRHVSLLKQRMEDEAKMRFATRGTHDELLLFFIPILREYDTIQSLSPSVHIAEAIEKLEFTEYPKTYVVVIGVRQGVSSWKISNNNVNDDQPAAEPRFTIGIFFRRLGETERLSLAERFAMSMKSAVTTKRILESVFDQRVHTIKMKDAKNGTPMNQAFSSQTNALNASSTIQLDFVFSVSLAVELGDCPSPGLLYPSLKPSSLEDTLELGWTYLQTEQEVLASRFTDPKNARSKFRVMTLWASKGFIEASYSVVVGLRTVGQWDEDIVLITDYITKEEKDALNCLGVKVSLYSPEEFKKSFPWAEENHWYFKLFPFLLAELRKYEIIQYLDLDVIVTGPIVKRSIDDFGPGVTLIMEDNNWDESFIARELFWMDQSAQSTSDMIKLLKSEFDGIDRRSNGPNHSPSAGACFHAVLVSRLPSPEILMERFRTITARYHSILKWGDQPLIMLTFWGGWRMKYGHSDWQTPFNFAFDRRNKHARTGELIRYIHTGGGMRPNLVSSPYKPFELSYRYWGAKLLNCPFLMTSWTKW